MTVLDCWARDRVDLRVLLACALMVGLPTTAPLWAQTADGEVTSSYRDATARAIHEAAMAERLRFDDSLLKYTALVRQRIGAAMRLPLKDRTLYRSESAHRLWWNRDGEDLVQLLAFREQHPGGVDVEALELDRFNDSFDPMDDRLFFGLAEDEDDLGDPEGDDFWFEHPLYPEYVDRYWFSSGDTLTLGLPDGRQVLAIELQVVPRVADVHRMTGSLWIEPEQGALVRAVYRLSDRFDAFRDIPDLQKEEDDDLRFVPGIFKPWTADIEMIAVDYSLWEFEAWLPRSMRVDVLVAAGILKVPVSVDYSYDVESVTTRQSVEDGAHEDLPEMHFRTRSEAMAYLNQLAFGEDVAYDVSFVREDESETRMLVPEDRTVLSGSDELPPPIWEDAPGFTSKAELEEMFGGLADLPMAPLPQVPSTLRWGLQRPDLLRYNRVEGASVGARWQARPNSFMGPLTFSATGRIGYGDLRPNVNLGLTHEGLTRRVTLSGYHELAAIDERARHLGLGNSLMASLFGRDDGDYYYRSGGAVEWTPPTAARQSARLRLYSEYHHAAELSSEFALFHFWKDNCCFRPNLSADEGWEHGALLEWTPWWGSDPLLAQGGLDASIQGGFGDQEYARASLVLRGVVPLPLQMRLGVAVGGGSSWGDPSVQRLWHLGGARSLRGYDPRLMSGRDFVRGRAELARTASFGALSVFSDYGWAGQRPDFNVRQGFYSIGAGASLLDGLLRFDVGYGLKDPKGFRVDFYLDGIL